MKALDTNVLIRFLVADDEKQANRVRLLFKQAEADQQKLYVPILVVLEMLWVLSLCIRFRGIRFWMRYKTCC